MKQQTIDNSVLKLPSDEWCQWEQIVIFCRRIWDILLRNTGRGMIRRGGDIIELSLTIYNTRSRTRSGRIRSHDSATNWECWSRSSGLPYMEGWNRLSQLWHFGMDSQFWFEIYILYSPSFVFFYFIPPTPTSHFPLHRKILFVIFQIKCRQL